jgi:hypothetical protein
MWYQGATDKAFFKNHDSSTHKLYSKYQCIKIMSLEDISWLSKRSTDIVQNKEKTKWHSKKQPDNNSLSSAHEKYVF